VKKAFGISVAAAVFIVGFVGLSCGTLPARESSASSSPRTEAPAQFFGDYEREVTEADITAAGAQTREVTSFRRVPDGLWRLTIKPDELRFFAPDSGFVYESFREDPTGPSSGRLTLLDLWPNTQSKFCPVGRAVGKYTWRRDGDDLVIVLVNDPECHDRVAVVVGRWRSK
jgi:hypothetical protein